MTAASLKLPGKLGDPNLTLATDPRTDPRVIASLAQSGMDAVEEAPSVGPGSPYAEILEYVGALEAGLRGPTARAWRTWQDSRRTRSR